MQLACLKVLQVYKMKYLNPYLERLERLADNATLRSELSSWPLATESPGSPAKQDRAALIPLLVQLLFPRMRKRSGRLGGNGAPGSARVAILNTLAQLEPEELSPLLECFLEPLSPLFLKPDSPALIAEAPKPRADRPNLDQRLIPETWWAAHLANGDCSWWLEVVWPCRHRLSPSPESLGLRLWACF